MQLQIDDKICCKKSCQDTSDPPCWKEVDSNFICKEMKILWMKF